MLASEIELPPPAPWEPCMILSLSPIITAPMQTTLTCNVSAPWAWGADFTIVPEELHRGARLFVIRYSDEEGMDLVVHFVEHPEKVGEASCLGKRLKASSRTGP
jgi:hypothetical protein